MRDTHVVTFGHEYREPPSFADRVYDVRDLEDVPFDHEHKLEQRAQEIMEELETGDCIAIGCDFGHDRSPYIAKLIEENYPGVIVDHLDYSKKVKEYEDATSEGEQRRHSGGERSGDGQERLQAGPGSGSGSEQGGQGSEE